MAKIVEISDGHETPATERTSIELLAPARDPETGRAALDCGADAVYIGGPGFGARRAAANSVEDIAALASYAHPFGARVYVTLNTLLFDGELADAERVARELIEAGVDAFIIQDMAWLRMGLGLGSVGGCGQSDNAAGVEFHASTQIANITPEDVAFWGRAGFSRVILERALSIDDIRNIRAFCDSKKGVGRRLELEAFVHGAICVGYSGRCFMSRSMGTRSGNRGDCSQPCRLPYDLVGGKGGNEVLAAGRHLLSVCDLDLSSHIGELMDAGVSSFKIEGRLKDISYVRNVVSYYRAIIDGELARRPDLGRASVGLSIPDFVPDPSKSFSRGAGDYFFGGVRPGVASPDTPKSLGEPIGRVEKTGHERTGNGYFIVARAATRRLASGDGICFMTGDKLSGTNINRVEGERVYPNRMEGIAAGTEIYRNYDHAFTRTVERSRTRRRIRVSAAMNMTPEAVSVVFTDETGSRVGVARAASDLSAGVFDEARNPGKMIMVAREELSRSGDTIFEVAGVEFPGAESRGGIRFVPVSMLAELRREGLERLMEARQRIVPERHPAAEDMSAQFPRDGVTSVENVTNRLAERFYRDHGVRDIEPGLDLRPSMDGQTVMRTRYCIRRETGTCLREMAGYGADGEMWLRRGEMRWRLDFDCGACEMTVSKVGSAAGNGVCRGAEVEEERPVIVKR